jgi:hypothetical protein
MKGRLKMTGARNYKLCHRETNGNLQEGLNGDQVTKKKGVGGVANSQETSEGRRRRAKPSVYIKALHHSLTIITENADPTLVTQGKVGDKPCLVTVDTGE